MQKKTVPKFREGTNALNSSILPLVRIIQMLFLTTPIENISQLLDELNEPIEAEHTTYDSPRVQLLPYLPVLKELEILKKGGAFQKIIVDEEQKPMELFQAIDAWVTNRIITKELETINSLLCAPCNCNLCCIGPDKTMAQEFFEVPLLDDEVSLFELPQINDEYSRATTAYSEPSLPRRDLPFYQTGTALYHWQTGWSMILPRGSFCPQLDGDKRYCTIYQQRPDVCRRPQIFCYNLERFPKLDREENGKQIPAYMFRNTLLAILDCPYVRELEEEIADYASQCGLNMLFKKNKQ